MADVKLTMQFGSAHFVAEGPQAFVIEMLERWQQIVPKNIESFAVQGTSKSSEHLTKQTGNSSIEALENVYDHVDGKTKIIAHINGPNKAEKTRSTALLLMYANYLKGQEVTTAEDIREACADQGCLDSSNFASHLKGLKEKVAMNPKAGGGYDVKLTAPGRKAAQALAESINHAAE